MTGPTVDGRGRKVTKEWRDNEVRRLRALREANDGRLPERDLTEAARRLNLSARHVRRLVDDTGSGSRRAPGYVADDTALRALGAGGSIKNAHATLVKDAGFTRSARTLARGFERAPRPLVSGAWHGYQAYSDDRLTLPGESSGRLSVVAMDHKQMPNLVLPDRRSKPVFPWLTTLLDHEHRVVLSSTLCASRPDTEIVVATFAEGVAGWYAEDGTWVGGKPAVWLTDNGKEFQTQAAAERVAVAGILREFSAPFASRQNGRLERWHETVEADYCKKMPAYHEGDDDENKKSRFGRRYGDAVPWPRYLKMLREWIRHYNEDRPHSELGGLTPVQSWAADPTPVERADVEQLRLCMMNLEQATVNPQGIRHRGVDYLDERGVLRDHVRKTVDVRFLPNTYDHIEVYLRDVWLCTAVPAKHLTPEARLRVTAQVSKHSSRVLANDEAARQMRLTHAGITDEDDGWDDDEGTGAPAGTGPDTDADAVVGPGTGANPAPPDGVDPGTGAMPAAVAARVFKEDTQRERARTHRPAAGSRQAGSLADIGRRLGAPGYTTPPPDLRVVPEPPGGDDGQEGGR